MSLEISRVLTALALVIEIVRGWCPGAIEGNAKEQRGIGSREGVRWSERRKPERSSSSVMQHETNGIRVEGSGVKEGGFEDMGFILFHTELIEN